MKIITRITENDDKGEKIKSPCRVCDNNTWHEILASIKKEDDEDIEEESEQARWHEYCIYQIIKCLGCDDVSFRSEYSDIELIFTEREKEDQVRIEIYPNRVIGRSVLGNSHLFPFQVKQIYLEAHKAICSGQPILGAIGIRALLESICRDKKAKGDNLKSQINNLIEIGILSQKGSDVLHQLRNLGNESAHEIKPHNMETLSKAMDVIEHLLIGVYIFSMPDK